MTTATANSSCFPTDCRRAAALYFERGVLPIPLHARDKKPIGEGWQDQRPTAADLDALFPPRQTRNVGLLLGKPSGLIDVDLDSTEATAAAPFFLPPTGWISGRRSSPRSHYWYRCDDPPERAADAFKGLDGCVLVELRGTGGQTMAPPSIHDEGERVEWHDFTEPARVAAADLRPAVARIAAAALLARHWPAEGGRQDAALALAGGMARAGWTDDAIENFIRAVATAAGDDEIEMRCNVVGRTAEKVTDGGQVTGWPTLVKALGEPGKTVVGRVCEWLGIREQVPAATDPRKKAPIRPPAPYRPFPTEAMPQPIRVFVEQASAAIGCDPSFVALPALTAAASLIGGKRVVRLKRGWTEPCVLWSCIIGESGTLKSPAIHAGAGLVYRLQQELRHKFKTDVAEYQQKKAVYDDKKRKAKQDGEEFKEEPPEPPVLKRIVVSDVTIEILAAILEDNPGGVLLLRDELAAWFNSFSRYKGKQGGSDVPNWLEMHRAGPIVYDRKTGDRRSVFVPRARCASRAGFSRERSPAA